MPFVFAKAQNMYNEPHRPQIHFSPQAHWMNDPNGMLYFNKQYHLFYQYYPGATVWGPMHWGHATSTDLIHWQHQPVALYPDSLGYIFSGSAVADIHNSSGFGSKGKIPLVAIFTHHDPAGEKAGKNNYQNQSIAYSLDEGRTWTKYAKNPVLKNPGIKDFRDPKVSWYEPTKQWIMTLATLDRISFYSSPDLKNWTKQSEFGSAFGAHGGVWECPDLFPLEYKGKKVWILFVSINPGGPNGGSATQYFTGQFDGKKFTPYQTDIRWLDNGPDDYAGVTWSNTGKRRIFLGWMGNWQYAQMVPTEKWRSAMTIPRELSLEKIGEKYYVRSMPVEELNKIAAKTTTIKNISVVDLDVNAKTGTLNGPAKLVIKANKQESFKIILSNNAAQKLIIGYDKNANEYYIDRSASGKINFENGFGTKHTAHRISNDSKCDITLIIDNASVELFADGGLTVMAEIFFPDKNYSNIRIQSAGFSVEQLQFTPLRSIYK